MRVIKEVNMSGLGEQLNGGKKQGRERNFISGMKMPLAELEGIGQAHLWGKDREFGFGLFKLNVLVGYPGGAVQQTLRNTSLRLIWKQRFGKIGEP